MEHNEAATKQHKYWALCVCIIVTVLIAGVAIGTTIASVRSAHRDEVIKVAAAENGCNYVHQEMLCVGATTPEE